MTERRRRTGLRSIPIKKSINKVDNWRGKVDKNLETKLDGSDGVSIKREVVYDDTRTVDYVDIDKIYGGYSLEAENLVSESIIVNNRKLLPENENETQTDFDISHTRVDGAFPGELLRAAQNQFEWYYKAAESDKNEIRIPFIEVDSETEPTLLENKELAGQILTKYDARGNIKVTDTLSDKHIPYNAREIEGPYGFYGEKLLTEPDGMQVVGQDDSVDSYIFDDNTPVPRGKGTDYWDWLPTTCVAAFSFKPPFCDIDVDLDSSFASKSEKYNVISIKTCRDLVGNGEIQFESNPSIGFSGFEPVYIAPQGGIVSLDFYDAALFGGVDINNESFHLKNGNFEKFNKIFSVDDCYAIELYFNLYSNGEDKIEAIPSETKTIFRTINEEGDSTPTNGFELTYSIRTTSVTNERILTLDYIWYKDGTEDYRIRRNFKFSSNNFVDSFRLAIVKNVNKFFNGNDVNLSLTHYKIGSTTTTDLEFYITGLDTTANLNTPDSYNSDIYPLIANKPIYSVGETFDSIFEIPKMTSPMNVSSPPLIAGMVISGIAFHDISIIGKSDDIVANLGHNNLINSKWLSTPMFDPTYSFMRGSLPTALYNFNHGWNGTWLLDDFTKERVWGEPIENVDEQLTKNLSKVNAISGISHVPLLPNPNDSSRPVYTTWGSRFTQSVFSQLTLSTTNHSYLGEPGTTPPTNVDRLLEFVNTSTGSFTLGQYAIGFNLKIVDYSKEDPGSTERVVDIFKLFGWGDNPTSPTGDDRKRWVKLSIVSRRDNPSTPNVYKLYLRHSLKLVDEVVCEIPIYEFDGSENVIVDVNKPLYVELGIIGNDTSFSGYNTYISLYAPENRLNPDVTDYISDVFISGSDEILASEINDADWRSGTSAIRVMDVTDYSTNFIEFTDIILGSIDFRDVSETRITGFSAGQYNSIDSTFPTTYIPLRDRVRGMYLSEFASTSSSKINANPGYMSCIDGISSNEYEDRFESIFNKQPNLAWSKNRYDYSSERRAKLEFKKSNFIQLYDALSFNFLDILSNSVYDDEFKIDIEFDENNFSLAGGGPGVTESLIVEVQNQDLDTVTFKYDGPLDHKDVGMALYNDLISTASPISSLTILSIDDNHIQIVVDSPGIYSNITFKKAIGSQRIGLAGTGSINITPDPLPSKKLVNALENEKINKIYKTLSNLDTLPTMLGSRVLFIPRGITSPLDINPELISIPPNQFNYQTQKYYTMHTPATVKTGEGGFTYEQMIELSKKSLMEGINFNSLDDVENEYINPTQDNLSFVGSSGSFGEFNFNKIRSTTYPYIGGGNIALMGCPYYLSDGKDPIILEPAASLNTDNKPIPEDEFINYKSYRNFIMNSILELTLHSDPFIDELINFDFKNRSFIKYKEFYLSGDSNEVGFPNEAVNQCLSGPKLYQLNKDINNDFYPDNTINYSGVNNANLYKETIVSRFLNKNYDGIKLEFNEPNVSNFRTGRGAASIARAINNIVTIEDEKSYMLDTKAPNLDSVFNNLEYSFTTLPKIPDIVKLDSRNRDFFTNKISTSALLNSITSDNNLIYNSMSALQVNKDFSIIESSILDTAFGMPQYGSYKKRLLEESINYIQFLFFGATGDVDFDSIDFIKNNIIFNYATSPIESFSAFFLLFISNYNSNYTVKNGNKLILPFLKNPLNNLLLENRVNKDYTYAKNISNIKSFNNNNSYIDSVFKEAGFGGEEAFRTTLKWIDKFALFANIDLINISKTYIPNLRSSKVSFNILDIKSEGGFSDEVIISDAEIYPIGINSGLNRYSLNTNSKYLGTLSDSNVTNELLKLVYGTGDSEYVEKYKPTFESYRDGTFFNDISGTDRPIYELNIKDNSISAIFDLYNLAIPKNSIYEKPFNQFNKGVITPHLPYYPNCESYDHYKHQFYTRDTRADLTTINNVFNTNRFKQNLQFINSFKVKPRGWRYGIAGVEPVSKRYACNPRRWGGISDITSASPSGRTDTYIPIEVRVKEEISTSNNMDKYYRSFTPYVDFNSLESAKNHIEEVGNYQPESNADVITFEEALDYLKENRYPRAK